MKAFIVEGSYINILVSKIEIFFQKMFDLYAKKDLSMSCICFLCNILQNMLYIYLKFFPPVRLFQTVRLLFFRIFPPVRLFQTVCLFRTLEYRGGGQCTRPQNDRSVQCTRPQNALHPSCENPNVAPEIHIPFSMQFWDLPVGVWTDGQT